MFRALSIRNYRLWVIGALVSNIGTWMQRVAQDWLVLTELTNNDGTATGIVTGLQFLPVLLLAPYAGLIADRYEKRKVLLCTQSFMGLCALVLGTLVLLDVAQLWHVYVLATALGVGSADLASRGEQPSDDMAALRALAEAVEGAVRGGKEGELGLDWE